MMFMDNTSTDIPQRVTPKRAAEILGVHVQSVYDAILRKTLPARLPKGATTGYTISREDLLEYKARTQPDGVKRAGRPKEQEAA